MIEDLNQLIEEAIKLELNVAKIYLSFYHRFPEDASFWWKIALEEKGHASLLKHLRQHFMDDGMFPIELVGESLEILVNMNSTLKGILRQGNEAPPSRAVAFNFALKLEESAGEFHLQNAQKKTGHVSEALKLLQSLNDADMKHADRIRSYMSKHGIAITSD